MTTKYCPECGRELQNPNAVICPHCGGALRTPYREDKNPLLAAFLSFLAPGAGQIYNGQTQKGVMFLVVDFLCEVCSDLDLLSVGALVVLLIFWIAVVVDAYTTAKKLNRGEPADGFLNLS